MSWYWERTAWPLAHALIPVALYAWVRDPLWTIVFVYTWETFEASVSAAQRALGMRTVLFESDPLDSLIGDPLIGIASMSAAFLLDVAAPTWRAAWLEHVSPWASASFIVIAAAGCSLMLLPGRAWPWVFAAIYVIGGSLLYGIYGAVTHVPPPVAWWLVAWLSYSLVLIATWGIGHVCNVASYGYSPWARLFTVICAVDTTLLVWIAATT